jgi:hypothetical protein
MASGSLAWRSMVRRPKAWPPKVRRCGEGNELGRDRAAADDEAHRLVDGPVRGRHFFDRHDFQIARRGVRRGRHVHGGELAAGALFAHDPGDETERLHLGVRKIDQHHALGAVGLGLQDVQQLARAAVDGAGQRDALDHRFDPGQQATADHPPRHEARQQDHADGGEHAQRAANPGLRQPRQVGGRGEVGQHRFDHRPADLGQHQEHELHHDPGQPDRQQGEETGDEQPLQPAVERRGRGHAAIVCVAPRDSGRRTERCGPSRRYISRTRRKPTSS